MSKPAFCICEIKVADQLCSNHTAVQDLCFRYICYLNPAFQVPSHILWLYSPVSVGPGQKPPKTEFLVMWLIL